MRRYFLSLWLLASLVALATGARAEQLAKPEGEPILTITGRIANTNGQGSATFDRAMIEALGMEAVRTATPWYDAPVTFEGVRMDKLMKLVGAEGSTVKALALNDYAIEIPMEDFAKFGVLLALKRDGAYMPVRDKGPLFIIYPYDSAPQLQTQTYYGRSAWQLARLIVE